MFVSFLFVEISDYFYCWTSWREERYWSSLMVTNSWNVCDNSGMSSCIMYANVFLLSPIICYVAIVFQQFVLWYSYLLKLSVREFNSVTNSSSPRFQWRTKSYTLLRVTLTSSAPPCIQVCLDASSVVILSGGAPRHDDNSHMNNSESDGYKTSSHTSFE